MILFFLLEFLTFAAEISFSALLRVGEQEEITKLLRRNIIESEDAVARNFSPCLPLIPPRIRLKGELEHRQ